MGTNLETSEKKKPGEWSETCIGYWSRSTFHSRNNKITQHVPICNGINIVRIKNLDAKVVPRSNTNGFEVLIQESEVPKQLQHDNETNSIGLDLIYNSYQRKLLALQGYWSRFKDSSQVAYNYVKNIQECPNKLERVNTLLVDEYQHLKDWFNDSWK